ncbi:MAG: ABC transporter ATP-binding protein [Clostridium sp.]
MLEIRNFSKSYLKGKKAVDNLNLKIEKGEIFGFIGHNGAGKTTTIKAIVQILQIEEGEIFINGMSIKEQSEECKKIIAYVPDNPDIYENLTGIQYLNFISDVFNVENRENIIKKYADEFELTKALGDVISSYSHGMKQKLVLISALIHKPKLLILDEPFVGLDPIASHKIKEIMKEMCREGASIFFSTHVLEVAEKICDKIAIIKKGQLVASGDVKKIVGDNSLEKIFMELEEDE